VNRGDSRKPILLLNKEEKEKLRKILEKIGIINIK